MQMDAWFQDIAATVLKAVMDVINIDIACFILYINFNRSYSLWTDMWAVQNFFDECMLLTDHINQLNVVSSLIEPLIRIVSDIPMTLSCQSDSDANGSKLAPVVVWQ
ncbi:hypothetical protein BU17DRAFT_68527 [Hysterangium stoloniferum]|nr:hypothetical protein BU17DRAFT_68527 [Hysterangium stoloniferum]